jgi:S-formylglutathione hydrolase FrmB
MKSKTCRNLVPTQQLFLRMARLRQSNYRFQLFSENLFITFNHKSLVRNMRFKMTFLFPLLLISQFTPAQLPSDTVVNLNNSGTPLNIFIKIPEKKPAKGIIVVLPGWKLPVSDWCTKTSLCRKALEQGYVLIMPEMAKSIYAGRRYNETRKDWLQYATRKWFTDTLIPYFQKRYNLLKPLQNNYILGLSTGARGVALLCLDCPEIFKKGAGLSGDYDQSRMPKDALMTGWYGSIDTFPTRWTGADNAVFRFKELKTPLYLGHGRADKIVPVDQTIQFADSLRKYKPGLIKCHIDETAGHTFDYWNSEIDAVLAFFNAK